jgi:hypothetical protein
LRVVYLKLPRLFQFDDGGRCSRLCVFKDALRWCPSGTGCQDGGRFFFGRSPVFSENIGTFYIANGMMYPSFVTAFAFDFSWGAARSDCSSPNVRRIQQNKIQQVFLGPLSVAAHKSGPLMRPLADKKC